APVPDRSGLNVLSLNTDLPIFPGGGAVEYLTLTHLAARAGHVGLVSMAPTRRDFERSGGLVDAGVELYLWPNPWMAGLPAAGRRALRAVHRWIRAMLDVLTRPSDRPSDTVVMDGAFANMAPSLIRALSVRPWQVLAIVQSSAAAMIDSVPRPLVAVLVMHD